MLSYISDKNFFIIRSDCINLSTNIIEFEQYPNKVSQVCLLKFENEYFLCFLSYILCEVLILSNVSQKKRTPFFLLLLAALVLAVLLYANSRTTPKSSFLMEGKNKLGVAGEVTAVSNSSSLIYCVQDLFLEAQEENLRVKNISGNVVWSQKLQGKIVKLTSAGENIIIVDAQNNINYYSLKGKLLWTYKPPYEIMDIFTEDNGSFLVEYKGMTGSHAEVFTQNGSKIGSIAVENSHVLSFSTGANAFSISILDTSAEQVKTKIITYNFKGDILWAQNFEDEIISKLNYSNNNKLLALGESIMYIYKNDGSLQGNAKIEGKILNIAISDHIITSVVHDKGKQYAVCYDSNMREQSRTEIVGSPLGIYPMKNSFILYYRDELMIITAKGELITRFKSNTDISSAYMTPDNKIFIVSNRKLQQLDVLQ